MLLLSASCLLLICLFDYSLTILSAIVFLVSLLEFVDLYLANKTLQRGKKGIERARKQDTKSKERIILVFKVTHGTHNALEYFG